MPFSPQEQAKPQASTSSKSNVGSSYPPLSAVAPKPFSSHLQYELTRRRKKSVGRQNHADSSLTEFVDVRTTVDSFPKLEEVVEVNGGGGGGSFGGGRSCSGGNPGFGGLQGLGNSTFSLRGSKDAANLLPSPFFVAASSINLTTSITSSGDWASDYKQVLITFYQKHNPAKLVQVDITLERYKGREKIMFKRLAAKYKVPNPLESLQQATTQVGSKALSASSSGLGGSAPTASSPLGAGGGAMNTSSAVGATQSPASSSPFGSKQPVGTTLSSSTPFGSPSSAASLSQACSPFGSPSLVVAPSLQPPAAQQTVQWQNPREMLVSFFQQKDPQKVSEVNKLLQKYRGNEDLMFRNLAKKYQLDPEVFGLSARSGSFRATGSTVMGGSRRGESPQRLLPSKHYRHRRTYS